jgi:glycosyltransferase involved in cell wall biosynthesis
MGTYAWGACFFLAAFLSTAFKMALRRVDVLHVSLASGGSTVRKLHFVALAQLFRVPYVIHLRGGGFRDYWNTRSAPMTRVIDRMFDRARTIVVLGSFWSKVVTERRPALAERIVVLPNATARRPRRSGVRDPSSPVSILYLGRIERAKGTPELIEALSRLMRTPGWKAAIVGDGDILEARAAATRAGLDGRVQFPGWLDGDGVEERLNGADILVLPSFHEGLPNAVVEAFSHGLAVVTTPVGALPDIVKDDDTGLLVQPGSVDSLTSALARLIEDEPLRRRLGENARLVHREKLDLDGYVDRLTQIWRAAATDREASARPYAPRRIQTVASSEASGASMSVDDRQ